MREDADAIEEILIRFRLAQRPLKRGCNLGLFGQRAEEARIDYRIHHFRKLCQTVRKPWRCAKHERHQRD